MVGLRARAASRTSASQASVFDASRSSACTDSSRCSGFVSSSFVCERPRRLWTNSITVGMPARATSAASCSGPDGSRCDVPATSRIASSAKLDQRLVEEDRLDASRSAPTRPRCSPRRRTARDASFAICEHRARASPASRWRWSSSCSAVSTTDVTIPGFADDAARGADRAAADLARRSRGSRARASPRRRARRGACPSASSRRARPGRAR